MLSCKRGDKNLRHKYITYLVQLLLPYIIIMHKNRPIFVGSSLFQFNFLWMGSFLANIYLIVYPTIKIFTTNIAIVHVHVYRSLNAYESIHVDALMHEKRTANLKKSKLDVNLEHTLNPRLSISCSHCQFEVNWRGKKILLGSFSIKAYS